MLDWCWQDKIEAEAQEKRKGDVDYTKLEADVAASRVLAEKVRNDNTPALDDCLFDGPQPKLDGLAFP